MQQDFSFNMSVPEEKGKPAGINTYPNMHQDSIMDIGGTYDNNEDSQKSFSNEWEGRISRP